MLIGLCGDSLQYLSHQPPGHFGGAFAPRVLTFTAPVRVSEDGWELSGCPEDGPAIGVDLMAWCTSPGPHLIAEKDASRKSHLLQLFHRQRPDVRAAGADG